VVFLAILLFVALIMFGQPYLGWGAEYTAEVQLGLFVAYILGIICGFKLKN
jgi:hypothetical protein